MEPHDLFLRFGVALSIGFLIGLQREYAEYSVDEAGHDMFAGVRTFALLGLSGCTAAYLAELAGSQWVFIAVLLALGALIALAYFLTAWRTREVGLTTEVAALLTVLTGALCFFDQLALAAALGVGTTVLLAVKFELRTLVRAITRDDVYATLRFAVITAIVLPVLPDQSFGPPPFDVLNPYRIWLMVVLISGISFLGYILIKLMGGRRGIGLTGFLGGLASSTAVTLSFSQRSQDRADLSKPFALAVIIAWTMMFPRILVEVGVVNPRLLPLLWPPIVAAGLVGVLYAVMLYFLQREGDESEIAFTNPFALGPAIKVWPAVCRDPVSLPGGGDLPPGEHRHLYFEYLIRTGGCGCDHPFPGPAQHRKRQPGLEGGRARHRAGGHVEYSGQGRDRRSGRVPWPAPDVAPGISPDFGGRDLHCLCGLIWARIRFSPADGLN